MGDAGKLRAARREMGLVLRVGLLPPNPRREREMHLDNAQKETVGTKNERRNKKRVSSVGAKRHVVLLPRKGKKNAQGRNRTSVSTVLPDPQRGVLTTIRLEPIGLLRKWVASWAYAPLDSWEPGFWRSLTCTT